MKRPVKALQLPRVVADGFWVLMLAGCAVSGRANVSPGADSWPARATGCPGQGARSARAATPQAPLVRGRPEPTMVRSAQGRVAGESAGGGRGGRGGRGRAGPGAGPPPAPPRRGPRAE